MKWEQVEDVGCGGEVKKEFTEIFASKGFWGTVPAIHAVTNSPRPNITAQYYATSKTPQSVTAQFRRPLRQDFADLSVETSPTSSPTSPSDFADLSVKISPTSPSRLRRPLRQDFADLSVKTSPTSPSRLRRPLRQDFADLSVDTSPTSSSRSRRPLRQGFADHFAKCSPTSLSKRGSGTASVQRFSSSPHEEFYQSPTIFDPGTT